MGRSAEYLYGWKFFGQSDILILTAQSPEWRLAGVPTGAFGRAKLGPREGR